MVSSSSFLSTGALTELVEVVVEARRSLIRGEVGVPGGEQQDGRQPALSLLKSAPRSKQSPRPANAYERHLPAFPHVRRSGSAKLLHSERRSYAANHSLASPFYCS